jgi:hypothetical protein
VGVAIPVPPSFADRFVFGTCVQVEIRDSGVERVASVEAALSATEGPVLVIASLTAAEVPSGVVLRVSVKAR